MNKREWFNKWRTVRTPQDVFRMFSGQKPTPPVVERHAPQRELVRFDKTQGPMYYLGLQICKRMGQIGYPSKVHTCYRSPAVQDRKKRQGFSKAAAFQSPHQFYEAVDICHETLGWPKADDPYWQKLGVVIRNVEADFKVKLTSGVNDWGWDFAHVELSDWRKVQRAHRTPEGNYLPVSPPSLLKRFKEVLPQVSVKDA